MKEYVDGENEEITLCDLFAIQAMNAIISSKPLEKQGNLDSFYNAVANHSYKIARKMIEARKDCFNYLKIMETKTNETDKKNEKIFEPVGKEKRTKIYSLHTTPTLFEKLQAKAEEFHIPIVELINQILESNSDLNTERTD